MRAREKLLPSDPLQDVTAIRGDSPAWDIFVGNRHVAYIDDAEGGLFRYSSPGGYLFRNTRKDALLDGLRRDGFTVCLNGGEL